MDKIKLFFKGNSIKTSFASYIIICLCFALILSLISSALCQLGQERICKKYENEFYKEAGKQGKILLDDGSEVGGTLTFYTNDILFFFSDTEKIIYNILEFLNLALIPVWFVICIGLTSTRFYRTKLQKPLMILDDATDNISNNNLDFTISYDSNDEMGKLCLSFEKMRSTLQENNFEMWRQMEERKQLNVAFSHDLRTPLTVLKGQCEMLLKYAPDGKMQMDKIIATLSTMKTHINRLENYVYIMNKLQRLEDIDIKKSNVDKSEIIKCLNESGKIICVDKELLIEAEELTVTILNVDISVIMQVYENMLSNAVRFAKSRITVKLSSKSSFSLIVSDDGCGFSQNDLVNAIKPFYKSDSNESQHFGMGLNICKILCEKHGGRLILSNHNGGALVKAVF